MRNLKNLDNFIINSGRKIFKNLLIDKNISIKKFSRPAYLNDNTYFMKIYFEGHLVIKGAIYIFEFTMDLITDNQSDVQADVPGDLNRILTIIKSDFNSDESRIIKKIINSIIILYSDELEFMVL